MWVQRGALPEWYEHAVEANAGSNVAINEMMIRKVHASEWAWIGSDFDAILDNNGTIDMLFNQTKNLLEVSD